jgi:hypothetical protein
MRTMLLYTQMSRKTEITNILEENLKKIDGGKSSFDNKYVFQHDLANQVFTRYKFLEEINDFPSLMFIASSEARQHLGGGVIIGFTTFSIRGHVNNDNAIESLEDLIEDIEHVINNTTSVENCLQDMIILSIVTDEGVLDPNGVVEMNVQARYEVE